jgi:hypothetical protein
MKHVKIFEDLRSPKLKSFWELNAPYTWDAVPPEDKKNYRWHDGTDMKEIEIGSEDAVERFLKWCGNHWARKENRHKRQDDGQCDTPKNGK